MNVFFWNWNENESKFTSDVIILSSRAVSWPHKFKKTCEYKYLYNLKFSKNSLISMIVHTGSLSDIEHILIDRRLSLGGCKSYRRPKIFFWIDNLFWFYGFLFVIDVEPWQNPRSFHFNWSEDWGDHQIP